MDWKIAQDFIGKYPELPKDRYVSTALAQLAAAAGEKHAAQELLDAALPAEPDGWSWPTDRGRLRLHQARHVLGERDAFDPAREEFVEDIANGRHGVATALWSVTDIFPVLFKEVPWADMWDYLDDGLKAMREYCFAGTLEPDKHISSDNDLLASLLAWSATIGVPMVRAQAARALRQLNQEGASPVVIATVENLLNGDNEARLFAMTVLADVAGEPAVADRFRPDLPALASDPDAGIACAAHLLAEQWNYPIAVSRRALPYFYKFQLPHREDGVRGLGAKKTHALAIEDPLDWTQGWEQFVKGISCDAGVDITTIRWRVGSLIQEWGGLERYGDAASRSLQARLEPLSMVLPYRRPQAEGVTRALRHVVGELWRAGWIESSRIRLLLQPLHADAESPGLPEVEPCPLEVTIPDMPVSFWGEKLQGWVAGVEDDVKLSNDAEMVVLAEWQRVTARETRCSLISERFVGFLREEVMAETLDDFLFQLPGTLRLGKMLPLYKPEERSSAGVANFNPQMIDCQPVHMIVLCPVFAAQLGWKRDDESAHIYRNPNGTEMARTVWWRDGLQQTWSEDDWHAEGQRIILSEQGYEQLRRQLDISEPIVLAWRRAESQNNHDSAESRFAASRSLAGG